MCAPSNDAKPEKDQTPDEWAERGQSLLMPADRLTYFEEGLKRDPKFHARAWYGIGLARMDLKDNQGASIALHKATQCTPSHPDAWNFLGNFLYFIQKDASGAKKAFEHAVADNPAEIKSWFMLGIAREDVGDLAGAEKAYLRYLEVDPNEATGWSNLGNLRFRKQNFTGALEAFEHAAKLDSQSESIWSMLGHSRGIMGDGKGSVDAFQRVVDLAPNKAEAWAELASALEEDHRFSEARPAWERAATLGDKSARHWLQRIRQLGRDPLARFAGQDDLKSLVAGALRSVPRNPDLYGNIRIGDANWYVDSKGPEMVKLNSNGQRWETASEWLSEIGMHREAEFAIRVALLCAPGDVEFLLRLAGIQQEQDLLKEASDTIEEVLSRQPENTMARKWWENLQALFARESDEEEE